MPLFLALLLAACDPAEETPTGAWEPILVSHPGDFFVIDARYPEDWQDGHIPGAANVHWTELNDFDDQGLWDALPSEDIAALLDERGIPVDQTVVIYGDGAEGWGDDGNVYWILRYLGHPDVRVLDGGWDTWLASGGEVSLDDGPDPSSSDWPLDPEVYADSEDVAAWTGVVLDVRSPEEWEAGRIPGATWFPWDSVFAEDGALLHPDQVRSLLDAAGVGSTAEVVTYCHAGVRAGHTFMVLEALGHTGVRNYVGSWERWTAEGNEVEQ